MNFLENPFAAKATPPPDDPTETGSPLDAAERTVKRWQLEHGRTRAKVETLQAEVGAAREDSKRTTQDEGRALYEERNSSEEALAAQQAESRVKALDAALAIAVQKNTEAEEALEQASRQVERAIDDEAVTAFLGAVVALEFLLCDAVNRATKEVAATHQAVAARCQGDTQVVYQLGKFLSYYPTYLIYYNAALINEGRRRVHDIHEEHKTLGHPGRGCPAGNEYAAPELIRAPDGRRRE